MTQFAHEWEQAERQQHAQVLYQLKRELAAKRQAEQAQRLVPQAVNTEHTTATTGRPVTRPVTCRHASASPKMRSQTR